MSNVFVSHSSQNAWLIHGLVDLVRMADPQAAVFCSSEASIQPGANYKEAIYESLRDADLFVAIVSREYWASRYCILELGAAYERYCFDELKAVSIQPMLVPPLDKGLALANTPLVEMQLTDLTDVGSLMLFLRKVAELGNAGPVGALEVRAAEYAAFVHRGVLEKTSLLDDAEVGAYFDERPECRLPRERIVRCQRLTESPDDERLLFTFHLGRLPYDPSFASVALQFWDELNLREYLAFDSDAALCLDVDNVDGVLESLTVELKVGDNRVFRAVECELTEGANTVRVPLAPINQKPLAAISQISLVIRPAQMRALDGEVVFGNLRADFAGRNLFEEA